MSTDIRNRVGVFYIKRELMDQHPYAVMCLFKMDIIPLRVEHRMYDDRIEVYARSPNFLKNSECAVPPEYEIKVSPLWFCPNDRPLNDPPACFAPAFEIAITMGSNVVAREIFKAKEMS